MNKEMYTIIGVGVALAAMLLASQADTRSELAALRADMRDEHSSLRADMRDEHSSLRAEMRDGHASLRAEMREDFAAVRADVVGLGERVARIEAGLGISAAEPGPVE